MKSGVPVGVVDDSIAAEPEMDSEELPLTGGRDTVGVMRVGDTVRRPAKPNAAFVRDLLGYLERQGFDRVPRFVGKDDQGRDTLTYLEGQVPADLAHFGDRELTAAAMLLRRFHDATMPFAQLCRGDAEVVCHNDWGPTNTVFRQKTPWGMIDFDTAAPGYRLWDIGYSVFLWLDLGNADYTGQEQARRIAVFAQAYDWPDCSPTAIIPSAIARQLALAERGLSDGDMALAKWASEAASWTKEHLNMDLG